MRNTQTIDDDFIFEYYLENGGKIKNREKFLDCFYYINTSIIINGRALGHTKSERDLSYFFEDMDRKYELQTLWDINGNFLKVVE